MVSSTEIPKAMLKTNIVEGFMGTPIKPINPAVMTKGNRLGINETTIILNDRNIYAMNNDMRTMARDSESAKFLTKYFVPF